MKKINQKQFIKILKENPLENVDSISHIEKLFLAKRKYISKIPPPKSNVIHLVSGGIDSISTWAMLLDKYKLRVHPVCIRTGQKRHIQELKSIAYFSRIFKNRYPKLYVEPFHLKFSTSTPEISKALRGNLTKTIHPQVLKNNFDPATNTVVLTRQYLFPAFFPYPGALAALFFELQRNIKIRTIFCSILPTDGLYNASQTLTAIRAATLSLCAFTNDYNWQVISPCFDNNLGLLLNKADLIRWSSAHNIPIEHAYTCFKGYKTHCGECLVCGARKNSFLLAGVTDKTNYLNEYMTMRTKLVRYVKQKIRPLKPIYQPFIKQYRMSKFKRKIFIKDYL